MRKKKSQNRRNNGKVKKQWIAFLQGCCCA